ncbi:MAG: exodeoxyribonuclease VII large subunit [Kiritimatiellaeota bacterium]|nr:exodeoxyribonuclease VII large subunit [Kiritimatiellota bacterium]
MSEEKIWTVSEVNSAVREVIEGGFHPFWLEAEIGTLNLHRSGHAYMTLKDNRNQIRGVFFGGAAQVRALGVAIGSKVEVFGNLTVYEVRGEYQMSVRTMRPIGVGDLQRKFEELKSRLNAEGLFAPERKKQLPLLPRAIGVVTSADGAALRDFLQIINRRFPNMRIRIYPATVQGRGAEKTVAAGVEYFNATKSADVVVVTRGGGSLEDLWPFNEEVLARAVAASEIPVVSAVGHEIDFTICDFVADMRVPTPSAAAELVVGRQEEFAEFIASSERRLDSVLELALEKLRGRLDRAANSPVFSEPAHLLRQHQQRLDELTNRLDSRPDLILSKLSMTLERLNGSLKALNPKAVLKRGYAIILDKRDGTPLMKSDVPPGTRLRAILAEGELALRSE